MNLGATESHSCTLRLRNVPESLLSLARVSGNLWWSWSPATQQLASELAARFQKNTLGLYQLVASFSKAEWQEIEADPTLRAKINSVVSEFETYLSRPSWWEQQHARKLRVAFFSAEFGLHASLPTYAGGLGVLAGDILKAASDLGIPMVGVSLLYHHGYFQQQLSAGGWQEESYPRLALQNSPLSPVYTPSGSRLRVTLPVADEIVSVEAWCVEVGSALLYLLDTDIEGNSAAARLITQHLYGGDQTNRMRQEMVLGVGGLRMLNQLGFRPDIYHMNEGHSAFLALEQISTLVRENRLSTDQALAVVRHGHLFTTHTPVPAGNDVFHRDILTSYLAPYAAEVGVDPEILLKLGRVNPEDENEPFSMSVLGLRTAGNSNGVSKLHGRVSRILWQQVWPGAPVQEVPISHVTNGIHLLTWISPELAELFDSYLGIHWRTNDHLPQTWQGINSIPDDEIWAAHQCAKRRLLTACSSATFQPQESVLTIGFARRFTAYKRATLLFRNLDRIRNIVADPARPVQILFAGKAHPHDHTGKEFIARIVALSREAGFENRVRFLENYDMESARRLVQGVDIWLNNPRRPLEASGTSGMKAAANGALNLSVLDGWWCEGFDGLNGWSIGGTEENQDEQYQDESDSYSLYEALEKDVIPMYYDQSENHLPRRWLARMKHSMRTIIPKFTASRMLIDYATRFYLPHGLTKKG